MRVTLRDVSRTGEILDAGLQAGANQSYGVSYQSSRAAEAGDEALAAAVAEGWRKAKVLAGAAGKTLGKIVSITESYSTYRGKSRIAGGFAEEAEADLGTVILPDGLSFSADLVMVFELLDAE